MTVQQAPPNRYETVVVTSPDDPEVSMLVPRTPFVLVPACPGAALSVALLLNGRNSSPSVPFHAMVESASSHHSAHAEFSASMSSSSHGSFEHEHYSEHEHSGGGSGHSGGGSGHHK
jgi:hypothetical protein